MKGQTEVFNYFFDKLENGLEAEKDSKGIKRYNGLKTRGIVIKELL